MPVEYSYSDPIANTPKVMDANAVIWRKGKKLFSARRKYILVGSGAASMLHKAAS
jgi:hypothetical protein